MPSLILTINHTTPEPLFAVEQPTKDIKALEKNDPDLDSNQGPPITGGLLLTTKLSGVIFQVSEINLYMLCATFRFCHEPSTHSNVLVMLNDIVCRCL